MHNENWLLLNWPIKLAFKTINATDKSKYRRNRKVIDVKVVSKLLKFSEMKEKFHCVVFLISAN